MEIPKDFSGASNISHLAKLCDVVFVAINDPADRSIHPMGRIGFRASESDKVYVNTESAQGRKSYADLWDERQKTLQEIGFSFNIPILELTTESHLQKDLVLGIKNMTRRKK
jgi:hypothetical protein